MKSTPSLVVLLCLVFGFTVAGRGEVTDGLDLKLQQVLDRNIERHNVRGVSAAVVFPDGILWMGASGFSHDAVPMDPEMLFAIGSVTKHPCSGRCSRWISTRLIGTIGTTYTLPHLF